VGLATRRDSSQAWRFLVEDLWLVFSYPFVLSFLGLGHTPRSPALDLKHSGKTCDQNQRQILSIECVDCRDSGPVSLRMHASPNIVNYFYPMVGRP